MIQRPDGDKKRNDGSLIFFNRPEAEAKHRKERYGLYYLRSMEKLHPHVQGYFLQGQHVTRHICRIWNGLWSDQFIESTFMRYGHSAGGIIGITLKPEALKIWVLSRHIGCKSESDMKDMEEEETNTTKVHLYHKEEAKSRVRADTMNLLYYF
ncbi:hypothetical protein JOQ06_009529 [Pogonophryne albipinna]|uniref:Uncharacterized protein n=1 Tax=Pogonophryne albipinna TaxID=1090488 RepID=A0AAD6BN57_9TELE|nr:hypothetical protein JOQ06_009529 [Pogonophryne albipinna]